MHADQIAAVERVREKAARKGVDLGIGWLSYDCERWWLVENGKRVWAIIPDDAAALIVTGALAKWLAGQGIAVYLHNNAWTRDFSFTSEERAAGPMDATDHLSALLEAALIRLDELPDKEKA